MAMFEIHPVDEQIKALPTVDTASGSVATFDTDMTENLVSCVCEVASGASEINVMATGKNFIDSTGTWFGTDVSSWGLSDSVLVSALNKLPIGSYTVTFKVKLKELKSGYTGGRYGLIFRAIKADSTQYNVVIQADKTDVTEGDIWNFSGSLNITSETIGRFAYVYYYTGRNPISNADVCEFYDLQIELGSATPYEPFGTTINIPFGETLSGDGSFDVLTGILTRADDSTKQLSANYIQTLNGINNIWCDTNGDTSVKYILSVGKAIS